MDETRLIDYADSFWSIPEADWSRLYVKLRLEDWPKLPDGVQEEARARSESWLIADLVASRPLAEFAFRTVEVFGSKACDGAHLFTPVLFDIDLCEDPDGLEELLQRTVDYARSKRWHFRVYSSGSGYHVEVHPQAIQCEWRYCPATRYEDLIRDAQKALNAAPVSFTQACIDQVSTPPKMLRMVGARHHNGARKTLLSAEGWRAHSSDIALNRGPLRPGPRTR